MERTHRNGVGLLSALAMAAAQAAEPPLPPAGNVDALPSCVSADWIHFGRGDLSATLDEGDRRAVVAEMHRLYPVLEHDGLPVSRVVLWRQASGALVYVAAIDNPRKAGESCFIATVSAARFSMTAPLRRKYLLDADS